MSDVGDTLKEGAESFGETLSQSDVDGKVFMIMGYRMVVTKFGERRVATVQLNGSDDTTEVWLGGALVDRQLKKLAERELLPCLVKLSHNPEIEGNPYILDEPTEGEAQAWKGDGAQARPGQDRPKSGHPEMDALVEFCKANGLTTDSGAVDSRAVLGKFNLPIRENEKPAEVFFAYCKAIRDEKGCDEDATYKFVLENLVAAMGKSTEPEPTPQFE